MPPAQRSTLSTGDFLAVFGIVVAITAGVLDLNWALRTFLVGLAIFLTVFAGRRHGSHPMIRIPVALALIVLFSYAPWDTIATDFTKAHRGVEWPLFVRKPLFHFALAAVAAIALVSPQSPSTNWRRYVFFFRSKVLSEQVWIDRAAALSLIKSSDWAKTRDIGRGLLPNWLTGSIGGAINFDRDRIQYERFIELTLHQFARRGNYYAREIDGVMKYDEGALREFLDNALTTDTLKRFGSLPE